MNVLACRGWARPAVPLHELDALVAKVLVHTIDKSIGQSYDSHFTSYISFCNLHNLPIIPSTNTLAQYIAFMSQHIAPKSLDTYLSGISFRLRPFFPNIMEICNSNYICSIMKGMKRIHGKPV